MRAYLESFLEGNSQINMHTKNMKLTGLIRKVALCTTMCLLLSCCKSEEDKTASPEPKVTLETASEMVFDTGIREASISFYANAAWTATVPDEVSGWCGLSQTSGEAGRVSLLVALSENETLDDRNAKITICCGTASATVFIVQKQKDALTATANRFEVEQRGSTIAVEIKSNVSYAWEMSMGTEQWISDTDAGEVAAKRNPQSNVLTRALKTETLYFRVAPNEETDVRIGEIIFYATGTDGLPIEETVTVYQREKSVVLLTKRQQNFSDEGGWVEAEINSNAEYEIKLPAVDWIQRDASTRVTSTHTVYFKVLPNETFDARQADIVFCKKGDVNVADTLHVTQAQKDGIILGMKEVKVAEEGAVVEVQVKANVTAELYIDSCYDWLQEVSARSFHTRALTEGKFYLKVAANPSYDVREARVLVRGKENPLLQEELEIIQGQQRKLTVKIEFFGQWIDQSSFEVEPEGGEIDFYFDTSVDYSVEITGDWLDEPAATRALKRDYLRLEINPYTEFNQPDRSAMVILKDKDSDLADTVTVTQKTRIQRTYHVATAGTLPSLVPDDEKLQIRSLILSGKLNGTDIHYIREMSGSIENNRPTDGKLAELDISAAEIVGGGDAYYATWGSGAVQPNPSIYYYTYDSGTYEERIPGISRTNIYSEGIGPDMFKRCHLQKIALPRQVRLVGKEAFAYSALSELYLESTVPPVLSEDVFAGVESLTVYVPSSSVSQYKAAEGWKDMNILP